MNRCQSVLISLALFAGPLLLGNAQAAVLPEAVRTTTNAADARPKIQPFITEQVGKLSSDDPAAQAAAKEAIVAEVLFAGGVKPSDIFLDAYSEVLEAALRPLLKSPDVRIRLNLAVIAARVSERAASTRLTPTVVALLADDNEAVALWAVKAAKALIPPTLNNAVMAKGSTLIPTLVATAGKFVNSGPLIQSAYASLSIEQAASSVTKQAWPTAVPVVVKGMQDIMSKRIDVYTKDGVPQMPTIESSAVTFLTLSSVWAQQPPQQQLDTVQTMANLISVASQRLGTAGRDRDSLVQIIVISAKGFTVIGLEAAVKPLTVINVGTSDADIQARSGDVYTQLVKNAKYTSLKRPPTVNAAAPAAALETQLLP